MQNTINWIVSNLIWELLALGFIILFVKFLPGIWRALKVSRSILKDNRDTRGNGLGKFSADRFLDIWYSNPKTSLRYESGKFYYKTFNNPNSRHWMDVIDSQLVDLGLIEIFDTLKGHNAVRPIRGWRNQLVAKMTQFYLVRFIGDSPQYYRDLDRQSKQ